MKKLLQSQKGSSFIIFALSMVVILGFVSLVTDIGMMTLHRARLSNATDSAALAGAQELIYRTGNASYRVTDYMRKNGYVDAGISISVEDDNTAIRVTSSYNVQFMLARVLGFNSKSVHVTARGKILPVIGVNNGVRPFAIEEQTLHFGDLYTLKEGGGDGTTGNYGAISLGGTGANVYYNNIVSGYDGRLMVGDWISTEPGNMSGPTENGIELLLDQCRSTPKCTYDHFNANCPRIITIAVVNTLDVNGRSDVQIMGFASFILENVTGSGHESVIQGRFIRTVTAGEVGESQFDYGLYGVRLMN